MVEDKRPSVRLGNWTPPSQYNQPQLEPDGDIRTKEHKVLADATVVQGIGENAETFTLRGDAFADDISELRDMKGEELQIRHSVHSGKVLVNRVSASSTGEYEVEDGIRKWVYNYTVGLTKVQ